jgi:hypothetical protein
MNPIILESLSARSSDAQITNSRYESTADDFPFRVQHLSLYSPLIRHLPGDGCSSLQFPIAHFPSPYPPLREPRFVPHSIYRERAFRVPKEPKIPSP